MDLIFMVLVVGVLSVLTFQVIVYIWACYDVFMMLVSLEFKMTQAVRLALAFTLVINLPIAILSTCVGSVMLYI